MSPPATQTAAEAGQAILAAADRLFYERGIAGVGMGAVRDAAGVSLRRLYGLHPSKRDLVAAWLEDRHGRWLQSFSDSVEQLVAAGTEPVLASFDAIEEWASSPEYRGCAFLNAIAETTEIDDAHRAIVANHKRCLVEHIATITSRAHPGSPEWLPRALAVLIDGAIVQSAVFGSLTPIADARRAAAHLVEALS